MASSSTRSLLAPLRSSLRLTRVSRSVMGAGIVSGSRALSSAQRTSVAGPSRIVSLPKMRYQSTSAPAVTDLSPNEYETLSSQTMETLHDHLERLVEEYSPEGIGGWEVEYSAGVLTLSLGPHGTYVINKQPPNQQIWMSSPFSGPMRFSFTRSPTSPPSPSSASNQDPSLPPCIRAKSSASASGESTGTWVYMRDNRTIGALLDEEIRSVLVGEVGKGEGEGWEGVGVL